MRPISGTTEYTNVDDIATHDLRVFPHRYNVTTKLLDLLIRVLNGFMYTSNPIIADNYQIKDLKYTDIEEYKNDIMDGLNEYGDIDGIKLEPTIQMRLANEIFIMENEIRKVFELVGDFLLERTKSIELKLSSKIDTVTAIATAIIMTQKGGLSGGANNDNPIADQVATTLTGELDYAHDAPASAVNNLQISEKLGFTDIVLSKYNKIPDAKDRKIKIHTFGRVDEVFSWLFG
jgi:hypothetical protein